MCFRCAFSRAIGVSLARPACSSLLTSQMLSFISPSKHFSFIRHCLQIVGLTLMVNFTIFGSNRVQFKTWNTENALPQNTVNTIVQTPDGYLWLATRALSKVQKKCWTILSNSGPAV